MSQVHARTAKVDVPANREWTEEQETSLKLWVTLARCYATYAKAIAARVQDYGLTTPQFGTLEALYHLGPLSLGELAEKLLVTGGNVTYVMDRLEDQGLVYRYRRPDDRRVIQAKLTPEGRDLVADVFPGHAGYIEHLSRHLSTDEQKQVRSLLKRLGTGIQSEDL
jgi:MarR family transcriptional regulator, 2-MHQ and catechol-resistance regulon repressor